MKRFLLLALGVVAAWSGMAATSFADAFGLFYKRSCCDGCSFCVRPYNAFSSVTCGVADLGCAAGGGSGCCGKGCFGQKADLSYDNGCSAFGTCGARIAFAGMPVDRNGCGSFGFCSPGGCLGHTPPAAPPFTWPTNTCGLWFAPQAPYAPWGAGPGMTPYNTPHGAMPQPSLMPTPPANNTPPAPTAPNTGNAHAAHPVSYQQAAYPGYYPYAFQPAVWYPGYYAQPGYPVWNAAGYWNVLGR
jgi:hypothetical protein